MKRGRERNVCGALGGECVTLTGIRRGEKWLIQNQDELLSRCSSTADMSSHSHTHCLMSNGEANVQFLNITATCIQSIWLSL